MSSWLERAQRQDAPVVDGDRATFVWQGEQAPHLIGDWTDWQNGAPAILTQVAPDVWIHTLTLPPDAYLEYVYWREGKRVPDPLNPNTTPNGWGETNHYFYMPGGAPTPLARRGRNIPHGAVTRHRIVDDFTLVGGKRDVTLYRPPVEEACPLLVVLDGGDYQRRAKLPTIVDNLIAQGRIRPIALALVANHRQARGIEYACSETTLGALIHHVLPLARAELDLLEPEAHPGAFGILGASMGGLMALYAGQRAPGLFGRALCQSGAFTLMGHDFVLWDLIRHGPVPPLKIWMDVGRYEWLLEPNRRMHDLLVARGYDVAYREYNAGHNYPAWRDDLWRGLEFLFGRQD